MTNRTDLVKEVFEKPRRYFGTRQFDVTIRIETVQAMTQGLAFQRILDIGCGDGSISIPLLGPQKSLTLLDLSENMLRIARSNVPDEFQASVDVRNHDFMKESFSEPFDLIICLGVLAHVDSPEKFLAKITTLLRPGGSLVLEFADSFHFVGRLGRSVKAVREMIRPARYPVNLLSAKRIAGITRNEGLRLVSEFRYALPPVPGIEMVSHKLRYQMVRFVNGSSIRNRRAAWGNLHICLLSRGPGEGPGRVGEQVLISAEKQ